MAYRAPDFFQMDDLLDEEEILVRDSVREWVSDRFMPVVARKNCSISSASRSTTG